jgi:hypothetical protein
VKTSPSARRSVVEPLALLVMHAAKARWSGDDNSVFGASAMRRAFE